MLALGGILLSCMQWDCLYTFICVYICWQISISASCLQIPPNANCWLKLLPRTRRAATLVHRLPEKEQKNNPHFDCGISHSLTMSWARRRPPPAKKSKDQEWHTPCPCGQVPFRYTRGYSGARRRLVKMLNSGWDLLATLRPNRQRRSDPGCRMRNRMFTDKFSLSQTPS